MKKIAIFLADGFEEIEAITPRDVFNRAGFVSDFISIKHVEDVVGANGVTIKADRVLDEVNDIDEYDMVVLPGGMPGAKYLSEDERVLSIIKKFDDSKKYVAAICASPALVIPKAINTDGRRITSYPGMDSTLKDAVYEDRLVVVDDNLITSRGPATALEFAYTLVEILNGNVSTLKSGMLYNYLGQKLTN